MNNPMSCPGNFYHVSNDKKSPTELLFYIDHIHHSDHKEKTRNPSEISNFKCAIFNPDELLR